MGFLQIKNRPDSDRVGHPLTVVINNYELYSHLPVYHIEKETHLSLRAFTPNYYYYSPE